MPRYKVLKSVAHNLGHSFLSDMNTVDKFKTFIPQRLLDLAKKSGEEEVRIDFVEERISPPVFDVADVRESVSGYREMLGQLVLAQGAATEMLAGAELRLNFNLARTMGSGSRRPAFECRVTITDDRGFEHVGAPRNWWSDPLGGLS